MTDEKEVSKATNGNNEETKDQGNGVEDETELESSIIRQVEYYFGDLNLPRDKFLREQVKLDDGWVPLDVLIKFNRLAKLSTDLDVIANALSKAGLLEVSEDNKKVRRNPEFPIPEMNEERRKELTSRTIYAKGFPKDSVLDDIMKFFKNYEEVENIVMRKYLEKASKTRKFKGSVFATFKTKEQAEKFMEAKEVKYGETQLLCLWQNKYLQDKQEEYAAVKEKREKKIKNKEAKEVKEELTLPTGTVLHFSEGSDKTTRELVKEALTAIGGEVAYIDFKQGDTEGWVRLTKENAAKELSEKITDGKLKVGECNIAFRLLEGEEEKIYLEKTVEEMLKRRKNQKSFRHHSGKGKNFKGKPGNKKRKHESNEGGPPAKVKADS